MLSVVKCSACGQAFQVEQAAIGKKVACPFCQAVVDAVAAPVAMPVARPVEEPLGTPDAPLSLDDAEPLPSPPTVPPPAPVQPTSPFRAGLRVGLVLVLTALSMGAVYAYFKYGSGEIPDGAWIEFAPEGSRCRVLMPGVPEEKAGELGGKTFTLERWFEKVTFEFGWVDLREGAMPFTDFDVLSKRFAVDIGKRHPGKEPTVATVKFGGYDGKEVLVETDNGQWIEWVILVPSKPQPRVYSLGVGGPKITRESPAVVKFLTSLRVERSGE